MPKILIVVRDRWERKLLMDVLPRLASSGDTAGTFIVHTSKQARCFRGLTVDMVLFSAYISGELQRELELNLVPMIRNTVNANPAA